jgi:mannose-6-phosphate isomerase-like protein (cupin superfamily)
VPEGITFTMTNTGNDPLTMFVIAEPVPAGFVPKKDIAVKNENTTALGTKDGHWVYQERDLLMKGDGLATIYAIVTLTQDPMTVGHPHFHTRGCEEIWTTLKGNNVAFLGKQLRHQPPGTSYMIPPDDKTNHSNINQSKTDQIKMLYVATRADMK